MEKPLSGIRVLELADYVSAPVCCRLLADLGAEVIKIERSTGNVWRVTAQSYNPKRFTLDENPTYDIYNTGKKHIVLNLKTADGMKVCKDLLARSDVFVTNNRPAALERLGLDYESLKAEFPQLIYAIGLGFGEKGPEAGTPAYDQSAFWARSGFLMDLAPTDGYYMPIFPPGSMGDTFTGITMLSEICAAIINRLKTGHGECVKSSLFHNAIFAMGTMQIWAQRPFGAAFPRSRAAHGLPNGYFPCKNDEYIFISAGYAPQIIPVMFRMLGHPEYLDDERFNTPAARSKNAEEFYQILCDGFRQKTRDEWLALCKEYDIPASPMQHFADLSEDEQAWANHYLEHVTFPSGNTDVMATSVIEMESVGELKTVPSPRTGENTEEVMKFLGYSDAYIDQLRQNGTIN